MKIKAIALDDNELPETVTVEMTLAEAILIGKHVGSVKPSTATSSGIWDALTGVVFNSFWEDGINDAAKENR